MDKNQENKVEPKHRMYLNVEGTFKVDGRTLVEPKHRMYLNKFILFLSPNSMAVEPKHRMYLNYLIYHYRHLFLK